MADRGLRRYQQRVARVRRLRFLWTEHRWIFDSEWDGYHWTPAKRWRATYRELGRMSMSTWPKWWYHFECIRPARVESNRALHLIERGVEDELLQFPNYRRPRDYYW